MGFVEVFQLGDDRYTDELQMVCRHVNELREPLNRDELAARWNYPPVTQI